MPNVPSSSSIEEGFITIPLPECKLQNRLELLLGVWAQSTKFSPEHFETINFKIWGGSESTKFLVAKLAYLFIYLFIFKLLVLYLLTFFYILLITLVIFFLISLFQFFHKKSVAKIKYFLVKQKKSIAHGCQFRKLQLWQYYFGTLWYFTKFFFITSGAWSLVIKIVHTSYRTSCSMTRSFKKFWKLHGMIT